MAGQSVVFVVEVGCVEHVEMVTSKRTPTRRRVDEGRPSKRLLAISFRHSSPSAACVQPGWLRKIVVRFVGGCRGMGRFVREPWAGRPGGVEN